MGQTLYFAWEVKLMEAVQAVLGPAGEALSSLMTMLGENMVLIAILAFLYWVYDKKLAKFVAINTMVSLVFAPMLKNLVLRRRPYMDHPSIRCVRAVTKGADLSDIAAQGFSFPSMHSSSAATIYGSIAAYLKRRWMVVAAVAVTFLVGLSRICLGVHYPTDVMAGWLIGAVVIFGVGELQRRLKDMRILYAAVLILGLPGMFFCTSEDYFTCYGVALGMSAGFMFEERFVNFEKPVTLVHGLVRLAVGGVIFLVLSEGVKLLLGAVLPEAPMMVEYLLRVARYALCCFVLLGVYPLCFNKVELMK